MRAPAAALALALSLPAFSLSLHVSQTRRARGRAAALARASDARQKLLLRRADADLRNHAYDGAAHNYEAVLQLDRGNAAARAGLDLARFDACHDVALRYASQGEWPAAESQLELCGAWQPASADTERELTLLRQVQSIEGALARDDGGEADAAMRRLAAAGLPFSLPDTLAPAYARFGAGDPPAAARLAAEVAQRVPAMQPQAARFGAFLRRRNRIRAWRVGALPALAAYLLLLALSLYLGLRAVQREERAVTQP